MERVGKCTVTGYSEGSLGDGFLCGRVKDADDDSGRYNSGANSAASITGRKRSDEEGEKQESHGGGGVGPLAGSTEGTVLVSLAQGHPHLHLTRGKTRNCGYSKALSR